MIRARKTLGNSVFSADEICMRCWSRDVVNGSLLVMEEPRLADQHSDQRCRSTSANTIPLYCCGLRDISRGLGKFTESLLRVERFQRTMMCARACPQTLTGILRWCFPRGSDPQEALQALTAPQLEFSALWWLRLVMFECVLAKV